MTWIIKAPAKKPFGSQFAPDFVHGACTLFGLAVCDIISKALDGSPSGVMKVTRAIYQDCRQYGLCGPNGAATQAGMLAEAKRIGLPVKSVLPYQDTLPVSVWKPWLETYCAGDKPYPVLVQVKNGQALRDAITGQMDERGLADHAFALYGTMTDPDQPLLGGYLGADGDNRTGWRQPVVYSVETLEAAQPISFVAFDYVAAPAPVPAPPPGNDKNHTTVDLPPNVAADLLAEVAKAAALLAEVQATINAAQQ